MSELFLYASGTFIVWALARLVRQLDELEKRVRVIELRQASMIGRLHLERSGDLEGG